MASSVFDNAMVSLLTKKIDIQHNATTTYCVLGSTSPAGGKTTFATYSNIKHSAGYEIAEVSGYTYGGKGINTIVPTASSGVTGIKTDASLIFTATGSTISCTWAYIQYALTSGAPAIDANPLLCYLDLGSQTVTNGTITFAWNAAGIMTLTS